MKIFFLIIVIFIKKCFCGGDTYPGGYVPSVPSMNYFSISVEDQRTLFAGSSTDSLKSPKSTIFSSSRIVIGSGGSQSSLPFCNLFTNFLIIFFNDFNFNFQHFLTFLLKNVSLKTMDQFLIMVATVSVRATTIFICNS